MAWPDTFPSSGYVGRHIAMSSSTEYWNENENGILKPAPSYLAIQICSYVASYVATAGYFVFCPCESRKQ